MASRFVQLTDPKKILAYLEADMLYYTLDGKIGKSCGGPEHGQYGGIPAIEANMRHCIYGILVEEDAEQTDSIYG